ncbi:MAG: hypothetical protein P8P74_11055 [Crocinitomicaceae bacterium]|nr:hypothetical protein [Crocinitomicaceae bacterium]
MPNGTIIGGSAGQGDSVQAYVYQSPDIEESETTDIQNDTGTELHQYDIVEVDHDGTTATRVINGRGTGIIVDLGGVKKLDVTHTANTGLTSTVELDNPEGGWEVGAEYTFVNVDRKAADLTRP